MKRGLNPCFNGRYYQRLLPLSLTECRPCLNPCFNGRYYQRAMSTDDGVSIRVLILVLMEDSLRVSNGTVYLDFEES